jgi:hypothetical protein
MELGSVIWLWKIDGSPFVGELLSRSELYGVEYTTFIPRIQYFCCDFHDFCVALEALLRRGAWSSRFTMRLGVPDGALQCDQWGPIFSIVLGDCSCWFGCIYAALLRL